MMSLKPFCLYINGQYDDTPVEMGALFSNIIYDLGLSEQLLNSYVRPDKLHIDKTVVQGLMAYTYAAMGDYQNAKIKADEVINAGYPLTSTDELAFPGAGSGFNNVNTPSWIWGVDLTEEIGHQQLIVDRLTATHTAMHGQETTNQWMMVFMVQWKLMISDLRNLVLEQVCYNQLVSSLILTEQLEVSTSLQQI